MTAAPEPCGPDLYWVETQVLSDAAVTAFAQPLDPEERARADRLRQAGTRRDFRVAHGLARLALSRARPDRAPADWRFRAGPHGRPEPEDAPGLSVNLSHARGLAVVAVSRSGRVGVDAEAIDPAYTRPETAALFCGAAELAHWHLLEPEARAAAFYALWTLKESLLKACGAGFSLDPRGIRCDLAPMRVTAFPALAAGRWRSWTATAPDGFHLSLSLDETGPPAAPRAHAVPAPEAMAAPVPLPEWGQEVAHGPAGGSDDA